MAVKGPSWSRPALSRACQKTYLATESPWNDLSRGATHQIDGADEEAQKLGIRPVASGVRTEDEGLYPIQHRYWLDTMRAALELEDAHDGQGAAEKAQTPAS